jgi:hypothetical protein
VEREPIADVDCAVEVGGAVQLPSEALIERSRTLVSLQRPQRRSGHAEGVQPLRGLGEQRPAEAHPLMQGMYVETIDVPDLRRVIIVVLGGAVLAEPADVLAGAGDKHTAAELGLAAHQLGPVPQPVRGKTLLVEGLREPPVVGRDPCLDMKISQRRSITGLSGPGWHGTESANPAAAQSGRATQGRDFAAVEPETGVQERLSAISITQGSPDV